MRFHLTVLPRLKEYQLHSRSGFHHKSALCEHCEESAYAVVEEFNGTFRPTLTLVCEEHFDMEMLKVTLLGFQGNTVEYNANED